MKVAFVLSGLAPRDVDPRLIEAAAAISRNHAVELWAPPGAVRYLAKRLPAGVKVHHADAQEGRAASRRLRPRRPRALRDVGVSDERLDAVLRGVAADLVLLPNQAHAERAARQVAEGTVVLDWSPDVLGGPTPATGVSGAEPHRVLATGPLVPASRFGDAIRAFDLATAPEPGWTMEVRGTGRHEKSLNVLIVWRSLEDRVRVLSAHSSRSEARNARVLMVTASHASPALQALEAAAAGVPVVGFDDSPVAAVVAANGGGHVVPAGSVDALAQVLRRLLEDDGARDRCAQRGREFAKNIVAKPGPEGWRLIVDAIAQYQRDSDADSLPALAGSGEQAPALTGTKAAALAEFSAVVERQLANANVPYAFVAAKDGRSAVVTGAEHRDAVAQALLPASASALGGVLAYVGQALAHGTLVTAVGELPEFYDVVDRLRVFDGDVAPDVYVDVELWPADADGVRHAPRANREAAALDDATWAAWLNSRSRTVTGKPLWDEVTFPIDAVFTWVDGADLAWQKRRDQFLSDHKKSVASHDDGAGPERFLSRDEIYYAVAAAAKNMPWLRRIVVVTDGQRHERIATEFPEVEFVDHREIFPDPGVLPVFNSHAIEACLHRIPGLAEHFVYFNDDMIVARPLAPSDLFAGNGVARFFASPLTIDFVDDASTEPHLLAAANNRRLLARDFDVQISHSMLHTPYPHRRSVLEEMEQRYADDFARTRASRFRVGTDVSVLSSFAQHYGWLTQRYLPGTLEYRFVRLNQEALPQRIEKVLGDPDVQVVALGEPLPGQDRHADEPALVEDFLRRLVD